MTHGARDGDGSTQRDMHNTCEMEPGPYHKHRPSGKRQVELGMGRKGVKMLGQTGTPLSSTVKYIKPAWPHHQAILTILVSQSSSDGQKGTGLLVRPCHTQSECALQVYMLKFQFLVSGGGTIGRGLDYGCGALMKGTNAYVYVHSLASSSM